MGGATGPECQGSEAVALRQDLGILGATEALQGRASALRHAGVAGRRSETRGELRRPLAHFLPTSGGSLGLAWRSPPAPRPTLSREASPAWRSAPPGPYFIYDLWSRHNRPPLLPARAHNGLGETCAFYLGFVSPRPVRGFPLAWRCALTHPPLTFCSRVPPVARANPAGPTTGQISFFLFFSLSPTRASCCSQPRNEMKIAPADPEVIVSRGTTASLPPPASPAPASRRAQG